MAVYDLPAVKLKPYKGYQKALDIISAPLSQPKETLTKGIRAGARAVRESRENIRLGKESGVKKIVQVAANTAVLGSVIVAAPAIAKSAAGGTILKAALKPVGKAALTVGTVAVLAPQTFKQFVKTQGAAETAFAAAVSPVAGIVVGLEKGAGLLKAGLTSFSDVELPSISEKFKRVGKVALEVGGLTAAGVGAASLVSKIRNNIPSEVSIPKINTPSSIVTPSLGAGAVETAASSPVVSSTKSEPAAVSTAPSPVIKNVFKPEINIAIAS